MMRTFHVLLLLAAFAASPTPRVEVTYDGGGRAEPSAGSGQHRIQSVGLVVEPVDADGSAGTLVFPKASSARRQGAAAHRVHGFAARASATAVHTSRSHLLERRANPSTAPPHLHA